MTERNEALRRTLLLAVGTGAGVLVLLTLGRLHGW